MTRCWVAHSLTVVVALSAASAAALATAPAAAAETRSPAQVTPSGSVRATVLPPVEPAAASRPAGSTGADDRRPVSGFLATLLTRLAPLDSGCDGVDWRQGVSTVLEPCQAGPGPAPEEAAEEPAEEPAGEPEPAEEPPGEPEPAGEPAGEPVVTNRVPVAGDGNLALGQPAKASSSVDGSKAADAVDGTVDTAWQARGRHEWWQVDLGRTEGLASLVLNWDAGALPTGYTVLLSRDGETWKRNGRVHGRPSGGPTVLELTAAKARFVRVHAKRPVKGATSVALRDVRVLGRAGGGATAGGAVGRIPGTGVFDPDLVAGTAIVVPAADPGLPPEPADPGFTLRTDPVTTAAILVLVIAGITALTLGTGPPKKARHRKRHWSLEALHPRGAPPTTTEQPA